MEILIGIYMRPDRTQVIQGILKRNKTIEIVFAEEIDPYLNAFESGDVGRLQDMFLDIKDLVPTFAEEVFIALPDYVFVSADCYTRKKISDSEALKKQMDEIFREKIRISEDKVYYSIPLICTNTYEVKRTIYSIYKDNVDALVEASKYADVAVASIEPASYAYFRSLNKWDEEQYLFQVFENTATMVSYSQVAGIFKADFDGVSEKNCKRYTADALENEIEGMMTKVEMSAKTTFEIFVANLSVRVLSDNDEIRKAFKDRIHPKDGFPSGVITDLLEAEQFNWMIPLGAMLGSCEEAIPDMYEPHPNFISVESANVLPQEVRKNSKYHRYRNLAKKYMKILIAVLLVLSVCEVGLTFYFNTFRVPETLQSDYDKAYLEFDQVKKEMEIISAAKEEDQEALEALEALLASKPPSIGFSDIDIGDKNASKDKDKKWIRFTIKTADPLAIRDYTTTLSQDSRLDTVNIEQIVTDTGTNLKAATVSVTKKKVE